MMDKDTIRMVLGVIMVIVVLIFFYHYATGQKVRDDCEFECQRLDRELERVVHTDNFTTSGVLCDCGDLQVCPMTHGIQNKTEEGSIISYGFDGTKDYVTIPKNVSMTPKEKLVLSAWELIDKEAEE